MTDDEEKERAYQVDIDEARQESQKNVLSRWEALKTGGDPPRFSDFDPLLMPELISNFIILERSEDNSISRVRYAGSQIVLLAQQELTGKSVGDILENETHVDFVGTMMKEMEETGDVRFWHESLYWQGRDFIGLEFLALPFTDDAGNVAYSILHVAEKN